MVKVLELRHPAMSLKTVNRVFSDLKRIEDDLRIVGLTVENKWSNKSRTITVTRKEEAA